MKNLTNLDGIVATLRAAGANGGRMGNGPEHTNLHLGIWGSLGAVLRACAAIGLSRTLASTTQRGPDGTQETVRTWSLSDLDGRSVGSIFHVSGCEDASASVDYAYTITPLCFAA